LINFGLSFYTETAITPSCPQSDSGPPGANAMSREFLKDSARKTTDFSVTDQNKGIPPPPIQKPVPTGAEILDIPKPKDWKNIGKKDLRTAIKNRKSSRSFLNDSISLEELSFLLWATQGIRKQESETRAYRVVPSAGCRHALETYIAVFRVDGLEKGIYRYLPLSHQLVKVSEPKKLEKMTSEACFGQTFAGKCAATFIWTTIPYRMEWRYGPTSYKVIALDAGHVCQNLYLACEAIGCGTCAIAAYDQELMDRLLGVDGDDEFAIYVAPVGKVKD
jgi:SagB-type dehydrogenase family enzyme